MPYSITSSTKILTLAIPAFWFILVAVLSEFAIVPGVCVHFIVPSGRRGTFTS